MILEIAVALALFAVALAGYLAGRRTRRRWVDDAAARTWQHAVEAQVAHDRDALADLPPGLLAADVYRLASTRGISIAEAAETLFTIQARARLQANVRRHHGRRRRR